MTDEELNEIIREILAPMQESRGTRATERAIARHFYSRGKREAPTCADCGGELFIFCPECDEDQPREQPPQHDKAAVDTSGAAVPQAARNDTPGRRQCLRCDKEWTHFSGPIGVCQHCDWPHSRRAAEPFREEMTDAELDTIIRSASQSFPTHAAWMIGSSDRAVARYALSFATYVAKERDRFMLALSRTESKAEALAEELKRRDDQLNAKRER